MTNCQCGKPITSKLTGELCTACYFASKSNPDWKPSNENQADSRLVREPEPESKPEPSQVVEISPSNPPNKNILTSVDTIVKPKLSEFYLCPDCNENHPEPESNKPRTCLAVHHPNTPKVKTAPDDGKKYCQSCLERGFGLRLATREWTAGYLICDECLEPLMNNIVQIDNISLENHGNMGVLPESIDVSKPVLNQFYDVLGIPESLRRTSADGVLKSRNDFFNWSAPAIINKSVEEVAELIEVRRIMLFTVKFMIEPWADYINRAKAQEREKQQVSGIEKSKKEVVKGGTSKAKLSKDEKLAKSLFPHLTPAQALAKMQEMSKAAKMTEFSKITGEGVCNKCKLNPCICVKQVGV